jgi:hypothetical protein
MIKNRLENAHHEGYLIIKLPVHPSTIEELALIRFWLLKLSQTHFESIYANRGILNPEFLTVLNPRTGPMKILFHANKVEVDLREFEPVIRVAVGYLETLILADFAQFICARRIDLWISLLDEPHRSNIFRFITGTGNTLEQVFITYVPNQGEFCELFVKVNFEIHFYNFQI